MAPRRAARIELFSRLKELPSKVALCRPQCCTPAPCPGVVPGRGAGSLPCCSSLAFESTEEAETEVPLLCRAVSLLGMENGASVFLRHGRSALTSVHSRTGLARCGSGPQGVPAVPAQLILREAIPATLAVPNSRKSGLSPPFVLWWHPGIPDLPSFEDHGVRAAG